MNKPLRAVLFDAVGTLIEPDPPVAVAYASAGHRFGLALPEAEVHERFRIAFARQEHCDAVQGRTDEAREHERWRTIVAEVFPNAADPSGLFAALWNHFALPQHWRLMDGALEAWRALTSAGLTLGVASNFDARLFAVCRGIHPLADCNRVFVSSQLGWRKPHLSFFRAIEAQLQIPPDGLILVGDDWKNDCLGARAAGWQAVFLNRKQLSMSERHLTSLTDLAEWLGEGRI